MKAAEVARLQAMEAHGPAKLRTFICALKKCCVAQLKLLCSAAKAAALPPARGGIPP